MLSKNKIKFIKSLNIKKIRDETGLFIIEGGKIVNEFINAGWKINLLIAKSKWLNDLPGNKLESIDEIIEAEKKELKKISSLTTPHDVLAIVEKPVCQIDWNEIQKTLTIVLETIQDPGNLGTIIRTAAWFGITNIICSPDSVDLFNQKVVQSSMGAIPKVKVHYFDLPALLNRIRKNNFPVYGTCLEGKPVYDCDIKGNGIVIFGNESSGISPSLENYITQKIMIPRFSENNIGVDSLNVAMATAIICSELRRKTGKRESLNLGNYSK